MRGFTLIELMIVISIMALLGAFTIANYRSFGEDKDLEKVPSVRASLSLYEVAQSYAQLNNRNKVSLRDVQEAMVSVLAHRVELKPSLKYLKSPEEAVKEKWEKFSRQLEQGDSL